MSYIIDLLLEEHSKKQMLKIVAEILEGRIAIQELVDCLTANEPIISQRASYVITGLHDQRIDILHPFIDPFWYLLRNNPIHNSIVRAITRYFAAINLPEHLQGEIFEWGTQVFRSKKTEIAIKANLMTVLTNIALQYNDLIPEVIYLIEGQIKGNTAGYISRAKKELKRLQHKRDSE